jgi:beta-galactosidase
MCRIHSIAILMVSLLLAAGAQAAPMPRQSFDNGWKFTAGDQPGAEAPAFADASWTSVDLPHDWSIAGPIAAGNPMGGAGGFFPSGVGWYRKTFTPPAAWAGRHVTITFDGVYMLSDVWINGEKLGTHPYGYTPFTYDLTPQLKIGTANVVAVRVDNSKQLNSRWYSGSGIYRHVWLDVQDPLHVPLNGVYITTQVQGGAPDFNTFVTVQTTLANDGDANRTCKLEAQLLNPEGKGVRADSPKGGGDGQPVESDSQSVEVPAHSQKMVEMKIRVPVARLWSPDTPNLYRAVTTVSDAGNVIDMRETAFGICTVEVSAEKGLLLNGQRILLCGGCVHHDNGALGAAAFDRAEERRVEILKAAGFNAIRTSHNPPSTAFLDACDRLGMLVMDEAFDCWQQGKNPNDYGRSFKDWSQRDIEAMVTRDRNHPAIILWSIGNEIPEFGSPRGLEIGTALIEGIRKFDSTRLITAGVTWYNGIGGSNRWQWNDADALFAKLDVPGYNYQINRYNTDHQRVPGRVIVSTESYPTDVFNCWAQAADHPWILGDFVWTALDYLGESGIGRYYLPDQRNINHGTNQQFPYHGAYCGDVDITGFRKPISYQRNITWDRGEKLYTSITELAPDGRPLRAGGWGVKPSLASWTFPTYEGKSLEVQVFSRYDSVRLFLNDTLVGEKPTTRREQFKTTFNLPYAPGTLKTVGIQDGKEAATMLLKTAGAPAGLRLTPDRKKLAANGQDLSFLTVESVDKDGGFQPNGDQVVTFSVTGPATIAGVGSGDYSQIQAYQGNQRQLFHGRAQVIIRTTGTPGAIEVKAAAADLAGVSIALESIANPN